MSSPLPQFLQTPLTNVSEDQPSLDAEQQPLHVLPNQPRSNTDPADLDADLEAVWPEIEASVQYLRDR